MNLLICSFRRKNTLKFSPILESNSLKPSFKLFLQADVQNSADLILLVLSILSMVYSGRERNWSRVRFTESEHITEYRQQNLKRLLVATEDCILIFYLISLHVNRSQFPIL